MNYHNAFEYLLDPHHKIKVAVIGCGGTGTQVLSILARMELSLVALGHLGLHVTVFDDDVITQANIGRQLFSQNEIGQHKSISLVTRFNRFYGTKWNAITSKFGSKEQKGYNDTTFNIYITCVDDFETRLKIAKIIKDAKNGHHDNQKLYWLDFGNTNNTGQAILGTLSKTDNPMPCFDEWAANFKKPRKKKSTPSCSLAEALEKQDLLINSSLANSGMQLLWRLFRNGKTPYRGVVINLETLTSNPIKI